MLCLKIVGIYIKSIVLNFSLFKTSFFYFFCSAYYGMVGIMDIYKSLNINIAVIIKRPEMLKFVPDHYKTKKCVSMQLKNYLIYWDMFLINIKLNKYDKAIQKVVEH